MFDVCAMFIRRSRCLLVLLLLLLLLAYTHKIMFVHQTHEPFGFSVSLSNFGEFVENSSVWKGMHAWWWWCCILYMAPLKCDEYWAPFRLCANTFFRSLSLYTYQHVFLSVCAIRFVWHCMFHVSAFFIIFLSLSFVWFSFLVRSSFLTVSTAYSRTTNRQVVICYSCCFDANRNFSIYSR